MIFRRLLLFWVVLTFCVDNYLSLAIRLHGSDPNLSLSILDSSRRNNSAFLSLKDDMSINNRLVTDTSANQPSDEERPESVSPSSESHSDLASIEKDDKTTQGLEAQELSALKQPNITHIIPTKSSSSAEVPQLSASKRLNCAWLFERRFRWNDRSNLVQMGFLLLLTLPKSQQQISNEQYSETQKTLQRILDTVRGWQPAGITANQMGLITQCDVDIENGRTIAMKLVQLGLSKALTSTFSKNYLFTRQSIRLRDANGNNLLHLAAMSEDPATVDFVLGVLSNSGLMTQQEIQLFFEERNTEGKTPLDIVHSHPTPSLSVMHKLKHTYATTSLHAAIQNAATNEFGRPIVTVAT